MGPFGEFLSIALLLGQLVSRSVGNIEEKFEKNLTEDPTRFFIGNSSRANVTRENIGYNNFSMAPETTISSSTTTTTTTTTSATILSTKEEKILANELQEALGSAISAGQTIIIATSRANNIPNATRQIFIPLVMMEDKSINSKSFIDNDDERLERRSSDFLDQIIQQSRKHMISSSQDYPTSHDDDIDNLLAIADYEPQKLDANANVIEETTIPHKTLPAEARRNRDLTKNLPKFGNYTGIKRAPTDSTIIVETSNGSRLAHLSTNNVSGNNKPTNLRKLIPSLHDEYNYRDAIIESSLAASRIGEERERDNNRDNEWSSRKPRHLKPKSSLGKIEKTTLVNNNWPDDVTKVPFESSKFKSHQIENALPPITTFPSLPIIYQSNSAPNNNEREKFNSSAIRDSWKIIPTAASRRKDVDDATTELSGPEISPFSANQQLGFLTRYNLPSLLVPRLVADKLSSDSHTINDDPAAPYLYDNKFQTIGSNNLTGQRRYDIPLEKLPPNNIPSNQPERYGRSYNPYLQGGYHRAVEPPIIPILPSNQQINRYYRNMVVTPRSIASANKLYAQTVTENFSKNLAVAAAEPRRTGTIYHNDSEETGEITRANVPNYTDYERYSKSNNGQMAGPFTFTTSTATASRGENINNSRSSRPTEENTAGSSSFPRTHPVNSYHNPQRAWQSNDDENPPHLVSSLGISLDTDINENQPDKNPFIQAPRVSSLSSSSRRNNQRNNLPASFATKVAPAPESDSYYEQARGPVSTEITTRDSSNDEAKSGNPGDGKFVGHLSVPKIYKNSLPHRSTVSGIYGTRPVSRSKNGENYERRNNNVVAGGTSAEPDQSVQRRADLTKDSEDYADEEPESSVHEENHENLENSETTKKEDNEGGGGKVDEKRVMGGGEKHEEDHHDSGKKEDEKGYEEWHEYDKGEKGHVDEDKHEREYDEKKGDEKKHEEASGYHEEHHHGEEGSKDAEYAEKGEHRKGHSTKGQHVVHKKDEYEKKTEFYDESHEEDGNEKEGEYHHEHEKSKGDSEKIGHHDSGYKVDNYGEKGEHEKGGHWDEDKGHDDENGREMAHRHGEKYGKKGGHEEGEKWSYDKGDNGKTHG